MLTESYRGDYPDARPGEYLLLAVSDTGCGIPPEHLPHIFEPFFTTKPPGLGTGLGLATTFGIVKQHGGFIHCYSEAGQGTVFRLYFPAARPDELKRVPPPDLEDLGRGSETVLVADDQVSIREAVRRMLEEYGYRVLTAGNGREALRIYTEQKAEIDIVLLDVQMPEMDGITCSEWILKANPSAQVILASGFLDVDMRERLKGMGVVGFLQKPFAMEHLIRSLREILNR